LIWGGFWLAILWLLLIASPTLAQSPDAEVNFYPVPPADNASFTVGDPITLRLEVIHPTGSTVELPLLDKEWGDFEVISQTGQDTVPNENGTSTTRKDIVVTSFAPGQYETPPLLVTHRQADGTAEELARPGHPLTVASVLVEGDENLRDLKPQAELPEPPLWPFILLGLLLAMVIAAALYWAGRWAYRRWGPKAPAEAASPVFVDTRPPEVIALTELNRIEALDLPGQALLKEHYSLVTECLRGYIEGRYRLPALEQTTDELQSSLRRQPEIATEVRDNFVRMFRRGDLVKFARFRPAVADAYSFLNEARLMVEITTPSRNPSPRPGRRWRPMFRFAAPWLLILLLVPLVLALLPLVNRRRIRAATLQYSDLRLTNSLTPSLRQRARLILPVLRLAALVLLIFAVARPQSGTAREIISGEGVDIAIVLDISGSMAALDFDPNRLGAAKQVIHDFITERQYDRIGLVIFATEAFSQVPPTLDYQVLERILDETKVSWDIGLDSGTAIGLGLANGANMLRDSKAESRVIILLTDGANNSGQIDPLTAAQIAKALDIRVYTIGGGAARPGGAAFSRWAH
jgi:hypothetical protein